MSLRPDNCAGASSSCAHFGRNAGNCLIAELLEPRFLLSTARGDTLAGLPPVFVPNEGQWDQAIRYAAHGTSADILFTDSGATFRSTGRETAATEWSLSFVDAAAVAPAGIDPNQSIFNYYIGDESTWRSGVGGFGGVRYDNLWNGIDARVMARGDGMKYEFHVEAGADPRSIAMRYDGVTGLSINADGSLSIQTPGGAVTDDAPIAWQVTRDGTRQMVPAEFVLLDAVTYTIAPTGAFDPALPLVLDPQLALGSYLGGSGGDVSRGMASDGAGGVWLTGQTSSAAFPAPGAFDPSFNGINDIFVAHVTAGGTLAFASFLGGSGGEYGEAVAMDGAGGAWVTGRTVSTNFPTPGGFDTTLAGSAGDVFVARVTSSGALTFGSYLGGTAVDEGMAISDDGAGGVWISGQTGATDFPMVGAFDSTHNGGSDGFVAHVTAGGALVFSSFLGGGDTDYGRSIVSDGAGGAWVVGETESTDFPTPGGFDTVLGGTSDAFVARISASNTLAFASYLGGTNFEQGLGGLLGVGGALWVVGGTRSTNFPVPGGFDTTYNGNGTGNLGDAFVARVNTDGTLAFGSYLGGNAGDLASVVATDGAGGLWLTGQTNSTNLPTPGGFDATFNGSSSDAFVAQVTATGALAFGSYFGGTALDYGTGIAPDGSGGAWMAVQTTSADLSTPGGFDTTYNGGSFDAFVARISAGADTTPPTVTATQFAFDATPSAARITFSENVSASLSLADLTLENLLTGQTIPVGNLAMAYDAGSNVATITFPGYSSGALPDGNYRVTLLAGGVSDAAGNPLPTNHVWSFFAFSGDANRDRAVNIGDFSIVAARFNLPGVFSQGDFNYDGVTNINDFAILASKFNTSLPAARMPQGGPMLAQLKRWQSFANIALISQPLGLPELLTR